MKHSALKASPEQLEKKTFNFHETQILKDVSNKTELLKYQQLNKYQSVVRTCTSTHILNWFFNYDMHQQKLY